MRVVSTEGMLPLSHAVGGRKRRWGVEPSDTRFFSSTKRIKCAEWRGRRGWVIEERTVGDTAGRGRPDSNHLSSQLALGLATKHSSDR